MPLEELIVRLRQRDAIDGIMIIGSLARCAASVSVRVHGPVLER